MSYIYEFKDSLVVGEQGEETILSLLRQNKQITKIRDVRAIAEYQAQDVDFIITINNEEFGVEVKTDTYPTTNLFFETHSCIELGTLGCMYKTKATFIYYFYTSEGVVYVLNTSKLRDYVRLNKSRFKVHKIANFRYDMKGYFHSKGYLIPLDILEKEFKGFKKIKF